MRRIYYKEYFFGRFSHALYCNVAKSGLEIKDSHGLDANWKRKRDLTGNLEIMSITTSSGRISDIVLQISSYVVSTLFNMAAWVCKLQVLFFFK